MKTSVPATAMISVADHWSRMLSRFTFEKKTSLVKQSVTNSATKLNTMP